MIGLKMVTHCVIMTSIILKKHEIFLGILNAASLLVFPNQCITSKDFIQDMLKTKILGILGIMVILKTKH